MVILTPQTHKAARRLMFADPPLGRTVWVLIGHRRDACERDQAEITNVWGVGYRLLADQEEVRRSA
jgi:DNA-binding response OmpR family regulator